MDFGWFTSALILAVQARALSAADEQGGYRWSAEVYHLGWDFNLVSGGLSTRNQPIPSSTVSDIASFPQDVTNQASNLEHFATPHILRVQIIDGDGAVCSIAMRSLVNSGIIPHARLLYPSPAGEILDGGKSQLKIHGMVYDMGGLDSDEPSLIYPIPINEMIDHVDVELPTVTFGSYLLHSIRKPINVVDFTENSTLESIELPLVKRPGWQPEMSAKKQVMSLALANDSFLISTNQFDSSHAQKVRKQEGTLNLCPNVREATIPLGKRILHLRKAGPVLSRQTSSMEWELVSDSITFDGNGISCIRRASLPPPSYHHDLLVTSSQHTLYFTLDLEDSELRLNELLSSEGVSVCRAVSLGENSCLVLDHAFDPSSCCKIFVLLQNLSNLSYVLLEYEDVTQKTKWKKLAEISNILPEINGDVDQVVFLDEKDKYTGKQFRINGLSTLMYPDGTAYIWGDILLAYDIRSGVVAWLPSFLPSSTPAYSDAAVQFATASEKGIYSILTESGSVWIGSAYPFEKHYSQLLHLVLPPGTSDYITIFFDSWDKLFGLRYETNVSSYSITREEIELRDSISSTECSRAHDCPRLFLSCSAEISAFHINHTAFSRTRHFTVRPPLLMPKAQENIFADLVHSKKSLLTYLTAMENFFVGEKIGRVKWWLPGNSDHGDELGEWWYTNDRRLEEYRKFLGVGDLLPNNPIVYLSKKQFRHETIEQPVRYDESWDTSYCTLPSIIYLDRNEEFRFNINLEHSLSSANIGFGNLRLVAISSDNTVLDVTTLRHASFEFHVIFEVIITGLKMPHRPPGKRLTVVSVAFYPWNPPPAIQNSTFACCSGLSKGTAFEQNMLVKVGCPPGRRLRFDTQRSLDILFSRGRTDDFECLYDAQDNIPCFTTSEFAAAFYIEDLVTGEQTPFEGNYTLQIVAGGTGYLENVEKYNDEEIKSYNYRPGDSKSLLSLIWSVLLESSSEGMQDGKTGQLIFDAKNPASIVFECRLDSPCGNIPFGTSNPGEFYLQIEVSNKGVDSSTNCDYTMRFMIHLIGIELSPRVHLVLMLITLSIISTLIVTYYVCKFHDGYHMMRKYFLEERTETGSDSESEYAEPPPQYREIMNRRLTISGIANTTLQSGGVRKPSLLAHSLIQDAESGKKRSSLRVHAAQITKSNTSRSDA